MTRKESKFIKELQDELRVCRELNRVLRIDVEKWRTAATTRVDTQMMDARVKLANSLGQMIEATSKAVSFIIGKECL